MIRGEKREFFIPETLGDLQRLMDDQPRRGPRRLPPGWTKLPKNGYEKTSILHFLWRDRDGWYSSAYEFDKKQGISPEAVAIAWRDMDYLGPFKRPEEAMAESLDWSKDWGDDEEDPLHSGD